MNDPYFMFAFATDIQIGMNSPDDRQHWSDAVDFLNHVAPDFVVSAGDCVDNILNEDQVSFFNEQRSRLQMPFCNAAGNHDIKVGESHPPSYHSAGLQERFGFLHKDCLFIGVNAPFMRGDFGDHQKAAEFMYLTSALEDAKGWFKQAFLISHWPLFVDHPGEPPSYWNDPNRKSLLHTLKQHKVETMLAGHYHNNRCMRWGHLTCVTSVGLCKSLHTVQEAPGLILFKVFEGGWTLEHVPVSTLTEEARAHQPATA